MVEWTAKGMSIQMNFTDPLRVSSGVSSDSLVAVIKNPNFFTSSVTGDVMTKENAKVT